MGTRNFFSRLFSRAQQLPRPIRKARRLNLEYLEDRTVLSKIIINPAFGAETAS